MDVNVNIRGNSRPFQDALDQVANIPDPSSDNQEPGRQPDNSRQPVLPPSDRLIEDLRREIELQRSGGANASNRSLLEDLARSQRELIDKSITARFSDRRDNARARMEADYEGIDQELEEKRRKGLQNLGKNANDPFYQSILDQQIEAERERRYRKVGSLYDDEFQGIDVEEASERSKSENDLIEALRLLTEELKQNGDRSKDGTDSDSYMNQLRDQRKRLLFERDNAPDAEGATAAQSRINDIDDQLRRVMNGGESRQGLGAAAKISPLIMGGMGVGSSLAQGDLGGSLMGAGGMAALMGANPYVAAAIIAAGAASKAATFVSSSYDDLGAITAYRSTTGGLRGEEGSRYLAQNIKDMTTADGFNPGDFGLSMDDFYSQVTKRMRKRGTADDWFNETITGVGLERGLALDKDAMVEGSKYDRYGTNITDAITQLVSILSGIKGSGVSDNDFTRVQEKFDIQQQLMSSYMGRTDNPLYSSANNTLAAFSATGVQQDSRLGSDIQQFQSAVQNPMNERMRALVFSTVQDIMPETAGRMDLVDRAIRDPKNEGKIMQAVVQRLTQQFGGTDTNMGYWVFKTLFPNIAPDRLDKYVKEIGSGNAGKLLKRGEAENQVAINDYASSQKRKITEDSSEMISAMTKLTKDIMNFLETTGIKISYGSGVTPNSTKKGKN